MNAALDADLEALRALVVELNCSPREREYIRDAMRLAMSRARQVLRRQEIVIDFPHVPRQRAAVPAPGDTPPAA